MQAIGVRSGSIPLEPWARNTAPANTLAALHVLAGDVDSIVLVLPADHLIDDEAACARRWNHPRDLSGKGRLVAFGLIIIDTADAALVARKDRVRDVKLVVDRLEAAGRQAHLFHRKYRRVPWFEETRH